MNIESEKTRNYMALLGGVILAGVVIYFLLSALNRYDMPEQKATATVLEKTFYAHRTDRLPNGTISATPDRYVLRLRVKDKEDEFEVSKDVYDSVNPHDKIQVTYTRLRLTSGISVTGVIR